MTDAQVILEWCDANDTNEVGRVEHDKLQAQYDALRAHTSHYEWPNASAIIRRFIDLARTDRFGNCPYTLNGVLADAAAIIRGELLPTGGDPKKLQEIQAVLDQIKLKS
jgi:hypothetical protein